MFDYEYKNQYKKPGIDYENIIFEFHFPEFSQRCIAFPIENN